MARGNDCRRLERWSGCRSRLPYGSDRRGDGRGGIDSRPRILLRSRWTETDARQAYIQSSWRRLAWLRLCVLQHKNRARHRRVSRCGRWRPSRRRLHSADPERVLVRACKARAKEIEDRVQRRAAGRGPVDPHVVTAVQRTVSALEKLGHDVEQHDMVFDAERAWETYARMGSVQTALFFNSMEPLVGRPVTADDVEPVTWATISRGRTIAAPRHLADVDSVRQFARAIATDLLPYDVFITPTLTQKPRPLRLLRHVGNRSRSVQRALVGRCVHVSVQYVRPTGDIAAAALVAGGRSDRRAAGWPLWR